MASGRDHDKATRLWSLPFGLILGLLLNPANGLIGGFAFAIGGLWLSPDLDTQSRALKRWGILKTLWWPYRKLIPHRSVFSHGPLIRNSSTAGLSDGLVQLDVADLAAARFANTAQHGANTD